MLMRPFRGMTRIVFTSGNLKGCDMRKLIVWWCGFLSTGLVLAGDPIQDVLDRCVGSGRIAGVVSVISDGDYDL